MCQVIFYLLSSSNITAEQFACRLTEKAWHQGHTVHLQTTDQVASNQLDILLWSWREDSFLPHTIIRYTDHKNHTPITIGHEYPRKQLTDTIINLTPQTTTYFNQFQRVCEIVTADNNSKTLSREKYLHYKHEGIKPRMHKI